MFLNYTGCLIFNFRFGVLICVQRFLKLKHYQIIGLGQSEYNYTLSVKEDVVISGSLSIESFDKTNINVIAKILNNK